jgi:hypothetical protein
MKRMERAVEGGDSMESHGYLDDLSEDDSGSDDWNDGEFCLCLSRGQAGTRSGRKEIIHTFTSVNTVFVHVQTKHYRSLIHFCTPP